MDVKANFKLKFVSRDYLSPFSIILHLQSFEKMSVEGAIENEQPDIDDSDISDILFDQISQELGLDERDFIIFRPRENSKEYIVKCRTGEAYTMMKLVYADV